MTFSELTCEIEGVQDPLKGCSEVALPYYEVDLPYYHLSLEHEDKPARRWLDLLRGTETSRYYRRLQIALCLH